MRTVMLNWSPRQIAVALFVVALLKALVLLAVVAPSYGADGQGYLRYVDAFAHPDIEEAEWYIRGTTPVYPFFAFAGYVLGGGTGYGIVALQIVLGAGAVAALYLALYPFDRIGALLAGGLLALDPQTGYLYQLVSTEALYIALLSLGIAALLWSVQRQVSLSAMLLIGVVIGLGAFVRPVGMLLIVPYAFFHLLMARVPRHTAVLAVGFVLVYLVLSLLHLWRFDFFAPYNTGGLYLGTRLFAVGGLYDRDNGAASEELYQLAAECDLTLSDAADIKSLEVTQNLRLCLVMTHHMPLKDISTLYQRAYSEATRAKPGAFIETMLRQLATFLRRTSDPYAYAEAKALVTPCPAPPQEGRFEAGQMFCPALPSPLAFLGGLVFAGMLAFSLLTRVVSFAGVVLPQARATRLLLLFCLAGYSYHAVVTAFAGGILSRYITVTNPYTLTALGFTLTLLFFGQQRRQPVQLEVE